jgi:putative tryptophan/tyrosine transport system substrate-binding protein
MKRRQFLTLLGGAAAAWPRAARAQQGGKRYIVGLFSAGGGGVQAALNSAFVDGLREWGWVEGKNVVFENRNAEDRLERLSELAADLVRLKVDVIVAAGTLAPLAAKQATATIPIVMTTAGDPLGSGLVASLARPGGNVTGMSLMVPDLGAKRLELLKDFCLGFLAWQYFGTRPIRIPHSSTKRRRPGVEHWGCYGLLRMPEA